MSTSPRNFASSFEIIGGHEWSRALGRWQDESLLELILYNNPFGQKGAIGFGRGLFGNNRLQRLYVSDCHIDNESLANLLPADGTINNSLTALELPQTELKVPKVVGKSHCWCSACRH